MLECKNLKKIYGKKCVVNNLSFSINNGEVFALLGSNGAGKTTTIKMILGLTKKDGGEIIMHDGVKIGYSPDTPYFPPFLNGSEVLSYYADIQKIPKKESGEEIAKLLNTVGLEEDKTKIKNYSKGMLQRLAFAQALLGSPDLLILDEPTAGLDVMGRIEIIKLIGRLKEAGKTIILNSHILSDIEQVCDRGIIIGNGNLLGTWDKKEEHYGKSLQDIFIERIGGMRE
ncbi:MAG: ABC transporter ATP-binding protein [Lachnospiraceae bacterium]|nr:ABC transporter ATP-binding protein [Lachnospiraceae bacterium]